MAAKKCKLNYNGFITPDKIKGGNQMKYIFNLILFLTFAVSLYAESSEAIIVYTMKGCSRCEFTINYLKEHNIKYTEFPTEIESNNSAMWSAIEKSGKPGVDKITMPVIINNGEVYFSIENLDDFVKKLSEDQ